MRCIFVKKLFVVSIWLFVLFLIPFNVRAFSVSGVSFTGPNEVKVGDNFDLNFKLNFSDISYRGPMGIYTVAFRFSYDKNVVAPTSVKSNIPYSTLTTDSSGNATVISIVSDLDDKNYECVDQTLFCDNEYTVSINFAVKASNPTNTSVNIVETGVGLFKVVSGVTAYPADDMVEVQVEAGQTVSLNVVKPAVVATPKKDNNNNNIPDTPVSKSNNKFLKSLEVENYTINFDKYKYNYDIIVEDDVNSLNVKADVQNSKAQYTITGNDDLKKNDNKVVIEVTAENGDKNIYTIYVKKKSDTNEEKKESSNFKSASINIDKKYMKIGSILAVVICLIVIISFIIKKINDRKIDKLVDKM